MRVWIVLAVALALPTLVTRSTTIPTVTVVATPNDGLQPQAVVDGLGTLHVIYFKGDPAGGDLYYVRRPSTSEPFSPPIRVNSEPGTAIAIGTIRGGHIALGRNGWIHVAWDAAHPIVEAGARYLPMYYARLAPSAAAFEPQRAIGRTVNLDGGTMTADASGHVYLTWHAQGATAGEEHRAVYVAASVDDGAHFGGAKPIIHDGGVCGCCGVTALVDRDNRLNILYRAATDGVHRDLTWAVVGDDGGVRTERLGVWDLNACPMTTSALVQNGGGLVAAWETEHQIYCTSLDPDRLSHTSVQPVSGTGIRSHPSVAVNGRGDRLIAWTDGTAWARGGTVSWELQDASGTRIASHDNAGSVPVWGLVQSVGLPDSSFVIVHQDVRRCPASPQDAESVFRP
jgi:hypothetical protein